MSIRTAKLTDGTAVEFDDKPIGNGAEKTAFFTRDRQQVILFFSKALTDRPVRRSRLERILKDFNPTINNAKAAYWKKYYCWPTGILDGDQSLSQSFLSEHNLLYPAMAVTTPAYRQNFFFTDINGHRREKNGRWFTRTKARRSLPPSEKGNFLTFMQICTKMSRAVRRMHNAGLAHSDLSNKNVLIDPRRGDACVIDLDTLVVPRLAPPIMNGTPGYIAPEVVAKRRMADGRIATPSIETDRYALGVLIYECLLLRHPIERQKPVRRGIQSAEEDEVLAFGEMALFMEHPTDRTNWHVPPPVVRIQHLGSRLATLFIRLFVEGIHVPSRRPDAADWERALDRTFDFLHPSPGVNGAEWFVLEPPSDDGARRPLMMCPFTRIPLKQPVPFARFYSQAGPGNFVSDNHSLTIWHGLVLMKWHTMARYSPNENADRTPQGQFLFYNGQWVLINKSGAAMRLKDDRLIPDGQAVVIKPGLELRTSEGATARRLIFDFMQP